MSDSDSDFQLETEDVATPQAAPAEKKDVEVVNDKPETKEDKIANKKIEVELKKPKSLTKSSFDAAKTEEKVETAKKANSFDEKVKDKKEKKKAEKPCNNFRLDPAGEFGTCIHCGWLKAKHGATSNNKAAEMLSRLKAKNSTVSATDTDYDTVDGPCGQFRLDTTATEFGMCKCGYKRAEHVAKKKNKAEEALERLRSSNAGDMRASQTMGKGACDTYKTDTAAKEFGVCVYCGYKKEEHGAKQENKAAQMLENLKKKNEEKRRKEEEEMKGIQEQEVPPEPEDPVETLEKEEQKADEVKPKKKKGKKCVIC